jgi:hypothetical protein
MKAGSITRNRRRSCQPSESIPSSVHVGAGGRRCEAASALFDVSARVGPWSPGTPGLWLVVVALLLEGVWRAAIAPLVR